MKTLVQTNGMMLLVVMLGTVFLMIQCMEHTCYWGCSSYSSMLCRDIHELSSPLLVLIAP